MRWFGWAMLLGMLVCGSGCWRKAKSDSQPQRADALDPARAEEAHVQPDVPSADAADIEFLAAAKQRERNGVLFDELAHGDQRGDWDTEAFHDQIKQRLAQILELMREPQKAQQDLNRLLADDFASTEFRPGSSDLLEVWRDNHLRVLRPTAEYRAVLRHQGPPGLLQAWSDLIGPFAGGSAIDPHFKVYRVQLDGDAASTEVIVDTDGRSTHGGIQQNATWQCDWRRGADRDWRLAAVKLLRFEEVHYQARHAKLFADCTEWLLSANDCFREQICRGVDHWRLCLEERLGIDAAALTGLALGDVNNDGLDDLYYCELGGLPNRLFVQQPDGSLADVSATAGVDWLDRTQGALFADWDNDGDQDLAVSVGPSLLMMRNDGSGRFEMAARLRPHPTSYGLAAADYDLDGRLDLYVCGYGNNYESFSDSIAPLPYHDANNGVPNTLYRNEGDWTFRDVTVEVGLDVNNRRFSFAASWEDFDNDGDPDLFIANDFGRKNLYVNEVRNSGRFQDRTAEFEVEDYGSGMSADWGDYDNDGRMDLWIGNMFSSAGNRITFQQRFLPGGNETQIGAYRRFARGNALFQNQRSGPFRDVSVDAGVTMGRWAWSSVMADINNDGWQDLLVANGYVTSVEPDDL